MADKGAPPKITAACLNKAVLDKAYVNSNHTLAATASQSPTLGWFSSKKPPFTWTRCWVKIIASP